MELPPLIGAIDQGTSSTRFIVFSSRDGSVITYHQTEVRRHYPQRGWVEQDPEELFRSVQETTEVVHQKLCDYGIHPARVRCIGLTNQRETCVAWDRHTGRPLAPAIVWLDNRTADLVESFLDLLPERQLNHFKRKTGLPIATYFTALKLRWLLDNCEEVRQASIDGRLMVGTVDSWILWKLTGYHGTDVTNASRTLLMNLDTLDWDPELCRFFGLPRDCLPRIHASSYRYGQIRTGSFCGVPICGVIGDQNAALVGQQCFEPGSCKITYGTGCFLQKNLGPAPVAHQWTELKHDTRQNLIITVAYQFGPERPPCYALEGSVAIAGAAVTWLRDQLQLVANYDEMQTVAGDHSAGIYFVPALQGLYAPYWDPNAAGTIIGLTQFSRKSHLVRATIEGVAFQTNDILEILPPDQTPQPKPIKVDGGLSLNDMLCQFLADISARPIIRAELVESTALGAAIVAGFTDGFWSEFFTTATIAEDRKSQQIPPIFPQKYEHFWPRMEEQKRHIQIESWRSAVQRSRHWIRLAPTEQRQLTYRRLAMFPFMIFALVSFGVHAYSCWRGAAAGL